MTKITVIHESKKDLLINYLETKKLEYEIIDKEDYNPNDYLGYKLANGDVIIKITGSLSELIDCWNYQLNLMKDKRKEEED